MRWSSDNDYAIDETIITVDGGRNARVLRVSRNGLVVGDFASWGDLLADVDLGLVIREEPEVPGPPRRTPAGIGHDGRLTLPPEHRAP
ncbi:hypothetical protein UG55_103875 [Frankia sp. EI5c]|uniref:hypothetical protein n=1 Tax=Frankia sp. EI5c TaxID=683316 RepID=UPI0007C37025|nr:hypothetical protein [Frankia sp. EI5c]OAA23378.1 hypothetical protein UG55_103875 [Frankia sp. EI5c]